MRKKRLDPAEVWRLKQGLDRDGRVRTWAQVAQHVGYSRSHVVDVAFNRPGKQIPVVVIDPRDYDAELVELLTDDDVLKWQERPQCLCGCGQDVKQETKAGKNVPRGAYRFFCVGHRARLPGRVDKFVEQSRRKDIQARSLASRRKKHYLTSDLAELMWQWRNAEQGRTLVDLGRRCGLSRSHIFDISQGRRTYVAWVTAARLMAVMGEPMTRPMAEHYRQWLRDTGLVKELPQPRISK